MSGAVEAGSDQGVAVGPVVEGSRCESPGCGGSGAVRGPGELERTLWRGRAGPSLPSNSLVACRRLVAAGASPGYFRGKKQDSGVDGSFSRRGLIIQKVGHLK